MSLALFQARAPPAAAAAASRRAPPAAAADVVVVARARASSSSAPLNGRQAPSRCSACGGLVPLLPLRRRAAAVPTTAAAAAAAPGGAGVDAAYLECAQALRSLGFQNAADIARVLDTSMNPNSLFAGRGGGSRRKGAGAASARADLQAADVEAVAAFLSSRLGLSAREVVAVVGAHPCALCYSVPGRLEPWARYLEEEVGVPDLRGAVLARPSLLGLDAGGSLTKIVEYLRSVDTAPDDIVAYVTRSI